MHIKKEHSALRSVIRRYQNSKTTYQKEKMIKSIKKTILVLACFSSVSAFAISDNQWLKSLKTTFKHSHLPSADLLASKPTWQCIESRTDGYIEPLTYQLIKFGALVLIQNANKPEDNYTFVSDPKTYSFTSIKADSGIQLFARETSDSDILIEMTSKDKALKTRSSVSFWLKVYGYISCTVR